MHVGNILCAVIAYLSAKSKGGKFVVRIEDLDPLRCPRTAARDIIETLEFLGLKSDAPIVYQSERTKAYAAAFQTLCKVSQIYPCYCSRAELHGADVIRLPDGGILYPGTCKTLTETQRAQKVRNIKPAYRIAVPDERIIYDDMLFGRREQDLAKDCGDFIIKRSDGLYAYQLAVTVDDGEYGITEVVRGADLLHDTPRQIYLQRLLGLPQPEYLHIPLVLHSSGRKLSKSAGDSAARLLKHRSASEIIGAIGFAAGLTHEIRPMTLNGLIKYYSADRLPHDNILLPPELC